MDLIVINQPRVFPYQSWYRIAKRAMDLALTLFALPVVLPVMLVIALAIYLDSFGPALFVQERVGKGGKIFRIYKFRTMQHNLDDTNHRAFMKAFVAGQIGQESSGNEIFKPVQESQVTRVGRILRKTSLDELPQLINVLLGDMSLVGPRPERPMFIQQFSKTIPGYMARHRVKAGITGWAQVHGWRGNTSLRKRIQYDLYYITHWTPWLDLHILWMTVWHGIVNRNAY